MKTYEFDLDYENRETIGEMLGDLFENRANFSVVQTGRTNYMRCVLRVDRFEGIENWFNDYFNNGYDDIGTYRAQK